MTSYIFILILFRDTNGNTIFYKSSQTWDLFDFSEDGGSTWAFLQEGVHYLKNI